MRLAADIPRPRLTTAGLDLFDFAERSGCELRAPLPQNPCTPLADPPPEAVRIRAVLTTATGRRQALTAPRIACAAGLWPDLPDGDRGTRVRAVIATWLVDMVVDGCVLVAGSSGYWLTDDPDEISHYCCSLHSRLHELAIRLRRGRLAAMKAGFLYHGHGHFSRP